MALFPSYEHKIYKNTFLQNVSVYISHPCGLIENQTLNDRCNQFFVENFGISSNKSLAANTITITNDELGVEYMFSRENSYLRVNSKNYVCFEMSMLGLLYRTKRFCKKVLDVDAIKGLSIQKVNIFPIKLENEFNDEIKDNLYKSIFAQELLSLPFKNVEIEEDKDFVDPIKECIINDEKDNLKYAFRYGILHNSNNPLNYNVVLDIQVYDINTEKLSLDSIEENVQIINQRSYEAFHYLVTPTVIKMMEKNVE